ncbi:hypothetical protein [Rubinisphaera sp. JC750]|uniref:hypothetical protein n=1 Tax=Rubinisphaera sp. JC750 TaxID=2898658 RepID=UPI001F216A3E|nr:hypothetical protein [Rubinisphaera sp. JC750]
MKNKPRQGERLIAVFGLLILFSSLPGCATSRWNPSEQWASLVHRSAKIPADATKEEIVTYVNQHTAPIESWRSTSARLSVSGVPIPLKAMLAVEQPNHFRLSVSQGLSGQSELDLGSNPDQLWFWARQMEPKAVMTCRHQEIAAVQDQLPVPFQPEWLMEVLCVRTIDATDADLMRDPDDPHTVKLVSHHTSENGQTIRKIVTIDLRKGEVVSHQLYDSDHRLIATAELGDYREFPNTEARLPHDITLRWEQQDMKMHVSLNQVEVNPPHIPSELWDVPHMAEYPVREISRDQLVRPAERAIVRTPRDAPKTVTHYELDRGTGVWMQEQEVVAGHDRAVRQASAAETAAAPQNPPVASATASNSTAEQAGTVSLGTLAPPTDSSSPPPFPGMSDSPAAKPAANTQTASATEWYGPPGETSSGASKKSRQGLIDGVPASAFEPPVTNSAAN